MDAPIQISSNLTVIVQKDKYGPYVRIQRKGRWICLSKTLWKIVNDALTRLRTVGEVVHLTKVKRLEVITFKEHRYVSFVQQQPDTNFKFHIHFNDNEWNTLLVSMRDINDAIKTYDVPNCDVCNNLKTQITLQKDSRRTTESKLSKKKIAKLREFNVNVENQMGMMCLYCGQQVEDDCHCHEFDCYMCEPQNFCSKCYGITVFPAV